MPQPARSACAFTIFFPCISRAASTFDDPFVFSLAGCQLSVAGNWKSEVSCNCNSVVHRLRTTGQLAINSNLHTKDTTVFPPRRLSKEGRAAFPGGRGPRSGRATAVACVSGFQYPVRKVMTSSRHGCPMVRDRTCSSRARCARPRALGGWDMETDRQCSYRL